MTWGERRPWHRAGATTSEPSPSRIGPGSSWLRRVVVDAGSAGQPQRALTAAAEAIPAQCYPAEACCRCQFRKTARRAASRLAGWGSWPNGIGELGVSDGILARPGHGRVLAFAPPGPEVPR